MSITSTILPAPNAAEGIVATLVTYEPCTFSSSSIILCRNTAPLVAFAYALLKRDVPCRILGRDIGTSLIKVVQKMNARNLEELRDNLASWHDREVERCIQRQRSPQYFDDQYECLCIFIDALDERSRSVKDLIAKIELLFSDVENGAAGRITLSTIHKSKGGEWSTVFLLDRHLIPSRYAMTPEALRQERNLLYVAITRSLNALYYISSATWKD